MKKVDFEKHYLFLLILIFVGGIVLIALLFEIKNAQSILLTKWSQYCYLNHLLQTKAPPKKALVNADELKAKLISQGFKPEIVRDTTLGVEIELQLSWKELAQFLSWISSNNFTIKTFHAEDPSGEGNFKIKVVIK